MILLDLQADTAKTTLAQLLLGKEGGKNSDAFAKMLQELSLQGEGAERALPFMLLDASADGKDALPEELLVLRDAKGGEKESEAKSLLHLLKGEEHTPALTEKTKIAAVSEADDLALLHPKIGRDIDARTLRNLIGDAKNYLKTKIAETAMPKEMPQTLRGLVALAEKIGIDVAKITVETVRPKGDLPLPAQQPLIATKEERPAAAKVAEHTTQELVETKRAKTPEGPEKAVAKETPAPLRTLLQEDAASAAPKTKGVPNVTDDALAADDAPVKQPLPKTEPVAETNPRAKAETQAAPLKEEALKPVQESPQSKTDASLATAKTHTGQSTAQQQNAGSQRDNAQQQSNTAAAAATATEESQTATRGANALFDASLSRLLQGDTAEQTETVEGETTPERSVSSEHKNVHAAASVLKSDSLDVKINEAKEMVRHFASDIKEAVQNYKPPFTRIKIQLNPVKLGEVDVTMVQRGNNVHINISSNSTAITTLAQNASELRTQLSQNGMGNATMNFSSNAEQQQHQQQNQQRQHLAELYEQFENSESFDLLDQLEIIVPRYV